MRTHARAALCAAALAPPRSPPPQADPAEASRRPIPTRPRPPRSPTPRWPRDGRTALAPAGAPAAVRGAIAAANRINRKPYRYGGGHARSATPATTARAPSPTRCTAPACLRRPHGPAELERWGARGRGRWITVYANGGHASWSSPACGSTRRARPERAALAAAEALLAAATSQPGIPLGAPQDLWVPAARPRCTPVSPRSSRSLDLGQQPPVLVEVVAPRRASAPSRAAARAFAIEMPEASCAVELAHRDPSP